MAATLNPSYQTIQREISPTYISSDLLSPDYSHRITVPSLGIQSVQPRSLGGQTWGEKLTEYGGIGLRPFLGQARVRDLPVSRSHRHFSSGLSRYEAKVQPYRLTPLTLSACRTNDQVLPPCMNKYLDPAKYVIPSALPKQSYFSHTCKCEVFPKHDPQRESFNGGQLLSENTADALQDYYRSLYETPHYATTYPDNTDLIKQQINARSSDLSNQHHHLNHLSEAEEIIDDVYEFIHEEDAVGLKAFLCELQTLAKTNLQVAAALADSNLPLPDIMKTLNEDGYGKSESVRKLLLPLNILPPLKGFIKCRLEFTCPCVISEAFHRQLLEKKKKMMTSEGDKEILPKPGIYPCWPPGRSYKVDFKKMQLKEVESLLEGGCSTGQCTEESKTKQQTVTTSEEKQLEGERVQGYPPGLPEYNARLNDILPEKLNVGEHNPGLESSILMQTYTDVNGDREISGEGLTQGSLYLPPIPLSVCLHPSGKRIQDKLGIRFKTEAHKRYQAMYPDNIPDLRHSRVHGKRYFFYGYHASAFRG